MFDIVVRVLGGGLRYAIAILVAGLASASVLAVQFGAASAVQEGLAGRDMGASMVGWYIVLAAAAPLLMVGLIVVGLPTWAIAAHLGRTSYRAAALVGAIETTVVGTVCMLALGGVEFAKLAFALPLAGAAGGLIFRALVLDDVRPPPAPPSATPTP